MLETPRIFSVVYRIIGIELLVTLLLSAVLLAHTIETAKSALIGGICCLIPNAYFAYRSLKRWHGATGQQVIIDFFRAEVGKLVMTAALLTAAFVSVKELDALALFGAFLLVLIVDRVMPVFYDS